MGRGNTPSTSYHRNVICHYPASRYLLIVTLTPYDSLPQLARNTDTKNSLTNLNNFISFFLTSTPIKFRLIFIIPSSSAHPSDYMRYYKQFTISVETEGKNTTQNLIETFFFCVCEIIQINSVDSYHFNQVL